MIGDFLGQIVDALVKGFTWIQETVGKWWIFLVAAIMVPVNFVLEYIARGLEWIDSLADELFAVVDPILMSADLTVWWAKAAPYAAMANAVVPVDFALVVAAGLVSLWVICTLIRWIIALIPGIG